MSRPTRALASETQPADAMKSAKSPRHTAYARQRPAPHRATPIDGRGREGGDG
ncbi:hypothetical protein FIBSPDRAFT_863844, partial [Athelia psychrophila]